MGITPSNNKRLMENFHRHQMLQSYGTHMTDNLSQLIGCPPALSSDGSRSMRKSWRYRGIHLHCNLLYLSETPTVCVIISSDSAEAATTSSSIPSSLTPTPSTSVRLTGLVSKTWRAVVVVDIQLPCYVRIHFDDQSCEFDQWMNILEGIHLLVPLDFLTPSQILGGGCLDEPQLKAAYLLLANGCFSLPETQSKTCQVTVLSADQKPDREAMSKESSPLKSKECSSLSKECSLSSSKESSLSTSHFSVGEKVEILSMLTDSRIDRSKEIWRGAKIIMIKKNNIRIHFLGWDKRWDTNIDVLRDGDRIKKCASFLPILKTKNSTKSGGSMRSFVSVYSIFESKKFYDALSMIKEGDENPSQQDSIGSTKSPVEDTQSALLCTERYNKNDDNATSCLNERQSMSLERIKSALRLPANIENTKIEEIVTLNDNINKISDSKNPQLIHVDNSELKTHLKHDKISENDKLNSFKKLDNCETVFTKIGNMSNKNGNSNPSNSLTHSRLFSSCVSPDSSVELFKSDKATDIKLNRNADCPHFLPNIVKELRYFQLSRIDEDLQSHDEKVKETFLLQSMNVVLNNLIEIENEKEKKKEIEIEFVKKAIN